MSIFDEKLTPGRITEGVLVGGLRWDGPDGPSRRGQTPKTAKVSQVMHTRTHLAEHPLLDVQAVSGATFGQSESALLGWSHLSLQRHRHILTII